MTNPPFYRLRNRLTSSDSFSSPRHPLQQQTVQLLLTCFPDKLLPLFSSPQQAQQTLYRCLDLRQAIVTTQANQLTGVLGYCHHRHSFLHLPCSALAVPVEPQQFYIEIVCTAPAFRHQGIAKQLLQQAQQLARQSQCSQLALDVCHTNEAARQLYRQTGFHSIGQHRAQPPLQHLLFDRMIAPLS